MPGGARPQTRVTAIELVPGSPPAAAPPVTARPIIALARAASDQVNIDQLLLISELHF